MSSATLLAVTGRATGIRYPLEGETMIGRSSSCGIQLLDEAVSRQHAVIRPAKDGFELEDLGGQNGCFLNGARVRGSVKLTDGATIAIGSTTFLFEPELDYLRATVGTDVIIAPEVPGASSDCPVSGEERSPEHADILLSIVARALNNKASVGERSVPRPFLSTDLDVMDEALRVVAERFGADRAFVLHHTADRTSTRPRIVASFGEGPITVSRTVMERVLTHRRAVVSGDAAQDVAFRGGVSLLAGEIRSLLAAPLLIDDRAIGMVHLDRRSRGSYDPDQLTSFIEVVNVLALVLLASEGIEALARRARQDNRIAPPNIVGENRGFLQTIDEAKRAARSAATVLITGETGTGKELLARLVHTESDRRDAPFVAVNCGALPETLEESELFGHEKGAFTGADRAKPGLFEAADGGTLFLDELGETSRATQVKLLRALQEKVIYRVGATRGTEVDVRIIAATARHLEDMVASGEMREDLYFRLKVIHLTAPPLRSRPEDIGALATSFLEATSKEAGISPKRLSEEAFAALSRHTWPGNVRELRNTMERLSILSEEETIGLGDLPPDLLAGSEVARRAVKAGDTLAEAVARVEREMILRSMARTGAVKSAVADALGISRVTLDAKLKAHGIAWPKKQKRSR